MYLCRVKTYTMKKTLTLAALMLFTLSLVFGEGENTSTVPSKPATSTISGKVMDMVTGEALTGVEVVVSGTEIKAYTDFEGNFEIKGLQPGTYDVVASLIAYRKSFIEKLDPSNTNNLTIKLQEE